MIARLHWPHVRKRRSHRGTGGAGSLVPRPCRVDRGTGARMRLLAIDSATERLALAAVDDGRARPAVHGHASHAHLLRAACRIETRGLEGGASASSQALPALMQLMHNLGWN